VQNNNHGTSEAAALFIGGHWCEKVFSLNLRKRCNHFARKGRKWLENRVEKLVEEDGSFSQHSVTYHRVLLDTLIFVEYCRRKLGAEPFSAMFYQRTKAAIHWLFMLTDTISGNAPNMGANDGAMFLNNHSCDYRDFRPSIQTASVLFHGRKHYDAGPWDEPCYWLGLKGEAVESDDLHKTSEVFPGGYVVMISKESWGMIRFPMYRFRPSHNDVMHFDLWYQGKNVCRDAGSYSYNPDQADDDIYFKSVRAHNTVCFDGQDQMPRLGRFMLGRWMRADHVSRIKETENGWLCWPGACTDWRGNRHQRTISWRNDQWVVEDDLSGPFHSAEIRFRLIAGGYRLIDNTVSGPWGTITIEASDCHICLGKGMESLYYWDKGSVTDLVISTGKRCRKIVTRFCLM